MTVTNYQEWLKDGSPWHPATPVADFARTMRSHGYTVYIIGAVDTHLNIPNPEDHAPFSHTPWPGSQPYSAVLGMDIMPGGALDWRELGRRIYQDKMDGKPGTQWIKYMNWTDSSGNCYHDSWKPNHARRGSSDKGHIHISGRTDFVNSNCAAGYDPIKGDPGHTPSGPGVLVEDGVLGPLTIVRWQGIMGTPRDGVIDQPPRHSDLVRAVQIALNARIHAGLVVDGQGINQDGHSVFKTTAALQRYLGTPVDGVLTLPKSMAVKALQHRLNGNRF